MADQTLPLNVSYEMKADDERQNCVGMESDEELCSSSSDSAEELYSYSTTDARGDDMFNTSEEFLETLCFRHFARHVKFSRTRKNGRKKQVVDSIEVSVILHMV